MQTGPAESLADVLKSRGVYAEPHIGDHDPHVRVGIPGAHAIDFTIHCIPGGAYVTDRDIQLGTTDNPQGCADLVLFLYGLTPKNRHLDTAGR